MFLSGQTLAGPLDAVCASASGASNARHRVGSSFFMVRYLLLVVIKLSNPSSIRSSERADQTVTDRLRHLLCCGLAAQIARMHGWVSGHLFDDSHQRACSLGLTQMIEQQHAAPECAQGVGQAFAHDVEGRAMNPVSYTHLRAH